MTRRRWRRNAIVATGLLGVVTVGSLVFMTPALGVRSIEVSGVTSVTVSDVLDHAGVPSGRPMVRIDPAAIERRVERIPEVASATVVRSWPATVEIRVLERDAVALVADGDAWRAVDADGIDFTDVGEPLEGLPIIDVDPTRARDELAAAVDVVVALPDDLRASTRRVEADTIDDIRLRLGNGQEVRWGSAERSAEKAAVLAALLARGDTDVDIYDVSSPDVPVTS